MSFSLDLIVDKEKLLALEPEWNELLEISTANNIFLTWEWITTWWNHFGDKRQLYVLVARDSARETLLGIAPLNIHKKKLRGGFLPHRALSFIGSNETAPDHLDFITNPEYENDIKAAFVGYIESTQSRWDVLDFEGVSEHSTIINLLVQQKPSWHYFLSLKENASITLPSSWEIMRANLGKNLRYNIGRYERKMEKEYPKRVQYAKIEDESKVDIIIETLLKFAREVRQTHNEEHTLGSEKMLYFHQKVAVKFLQKDWLRLYTLSIAEKTVAILYCYLHNNSVFYYQTGYDLQWKKYGTGRQILAYGVAQAITEGAKEFDFLRGGHGYKEQWANTIKQDAYLKASYSLYGLLIVILYKADRMIRRILAFLEKK